MNKKQMKTCYNQGVSGDSINYEILENNFNTNGILKFRLYSLEYLVKKNIKSAKIVRKTIIYMVKQNCGDDKNVEQSRFNFIVGRTNLW